MKNTCEFDCIEIPLRKFFYNYGRFVGRNPTPFVLAPVLFTLICAVGFLYENPINDAIYLYTPTNGPSKKELAILDQKFPLTNREFQPDRVYSEKNQASIIVTSLDGGNILRPEIMDAIEDINSYALQISVFTKGKEHAFKDICLQTVYDDCYHNEVAIYSFQLYRADPESFTFPQVRIPGTARTAYIASTFGGVKTYGDSPEPDNLVPPNAIVALKLGNVIRSIDAAFLIYQRKYGGEYDELGALWEAEFEVAMSNYRHPLLNFSYIHSRSLSQELHKNANFLMPKFSITFTILVAYSVLVNLTWFSGWPPLIDWTTSKPVLAVLGVINAGMGVAAAIGLLRLCNYLFNEIVAVVPFLIVPICVEYMFLMVAAWRRTNRTLPVDERLGESVSIHAVSIVISMFTGALAFGVGAITTIPAVQVFCVYACLSMFITLVFQFTFFIGVLAVFGHLENRRRHCLLIFRQVEPYCVKRTLPYHERVLMMGSAPNYEKFEDPVNYSTSILDRFFEFVYAPLLMHPISKVVVMLLLAVYLGVAGYGCSQLREGLKPSNLLLGTSYAIPHYLSIEKNMWPIGQETHIVINNASDIDFATPEGRVQIETIVADFANSKYGMGNDSVTFFLPDFIDYLRRNYLSQNFKKRREVFYKILKNDFLELNTFAQWRSDILWNRNDSYRIESVRFLVGLKDFQSTNSHRSAMETMREVATKYPKFNITTFYLLWQFGDQFRQILPNTLENVIIAMALMVIVSAVLIPHPICSLCVALAIASIDVGVVGYMTLWNVNLDAISMITIVMSVGFSVDFTAHVSYGYVALSKESDPVRRMQIVLGARTWPILEAGSATVLGILALCVDTNYYVIVTFFKTVFLVMIIGIIHAVVFLPVVLDLCIRPILACAQSGSTRVPVIIEGHGRAPVASSGSSSANRDSKDTKTLDRGKQAGKHVVFPKTFVTRNFEENDNGAHEDGCRIP